MAGLRTKPTNKLQASPRETRSAARAVLALVTNLQIFLGTGCRWCPLKESDGSNECKSSRRHLDPVFLVSSWQIRIFEQHGSKSEQWGRRERVTNSRFYVEHLHMPPSKDSLYVQSFTRVYAGILSWTSGCWPS